MRKLSYFLVCPFLIIVAAGWFFIILIDLELADWLVREDKFIQWFQFFFFMLTVLYCLKIIGSYGRYYSIKKIRFGFSVFFILALFVALEEISWGQRILGFETPDFFLKYNIQGQMTLHNCIIFQRVRHWLLILYGGTGIFLIFLKESAHPDWMKRLTDYLSPPLFFIWGFSLVFLSGIVLEMAEIFLMMSSSNLAMHFRYWAGRFTEIGEFGVAVTAFSYTLIKSDEILRGRFRNGGSDTVSI